MVEVAGTMGRRTVAECVEDVATLELVRGMAVDLAQGYAVGRPAPLWRGPACIADPCLHPQGVDAGPSGKEE